MRRWSPFGKSLQLVGLLIKDANTITYVSARDEQLQAQARAWAPTFTRDGPLPDDARTVAEAWASPWPWRLFRLGRIPCPRSWKPYLKSLP